MNFESPLVFNESRTYTPDDFDGSHATPLLLIGDEERQDLKDRQVVLEHRLETVAKEVLGDAVSESILNLTVRSIHDRMKAREVLNSQAYMSRLYKKPNYHLARDLSPLEIQLICEKVKVGEGTIEENELAGIVYGTKSSELSNITVLGNFRADERDEMFAHVDDFVVDANLPPTIVEYDKLKIAEYDRNLELPHHHIGAIRLALSHTIGHSKRGSLVKLRTSTVIDTRPSSGFNQDTVDKLLAQRLHGPLSQTALKWLLEPELEKLRVVGGNDTVYRVDPHQS